MSETKKLDRTQESDQDEPITPGMIPEHLYPEEKDGQQEQRERKPAMKTSQLRLQPGIEAALQQAALIGIGAIAFAVAGIALVRRRAVTSEL